MWKAFCYIGHVDQDIIEQKQISLSENFFERKITQIIIFVQENIIIFVQGKS